MHKHARSGAARLGATARGRRYLGAVLGKPRVVGKLLQVQGPLLAHRDVDCGHDVSAFRPRRRGSAARRAVRGGGLRERDARAAHCRAMVTLPHSAPIRSSLPSDAPLLAPMAPAVAAAGAVAVAAVAKARLPATCPPRCAAGPAASARCPLAPPLAAPAAAAPALAPRLRPSAAWLCDCDIGTLSFAPSAASRDSSCYSTAKRFLSGRWERSPPVAGAAM